MIKMIKFEYDNKLQYRELIIQLKIYQNFHVGFTLTGGVSWEHGLALILK